MEKKVDRRILRTKTAIRTAYLQLFSEKESAKITVTEIAERANVDRKTVYNYYASVSDILNELNNEMLTEFEREAEHLVGERAPKPYFDALKRLIESNMDKIGLIMLSNDATVGYKIIDFLQRWLQEALRVNEQLPGERIALVAEFIIAGAFSIYRTWFNTGKKKSLDEITDELQVLVECGLEFYSIRNP